MKQTIRDVLDDMSDSQINLASDAARETVSNLISVALKTKGSYTEYGDDEIEEQNARETWVCSICGKNTFEVEYDYIGSGTNHLGCELELEIDKKSYINDEVDETDKDKKVDWFDDADYYTGPKPREKNWSQKKHEDKVFGNVQKQLYNEMTSDGLPEGGDSQAVLESYKLAEEIVDNKDEKYIYESPDGGKTVFRRV
jgi:ribosomal protein L37E